MLAQVTVKLKLEKQIGIWLNLPLAIVEKNGLFWDLYVCGSESGRISEKRASLRSGVDVGQGG